MNKNIQKISLILPVLVVSLLAMAQPAGAETLASVFGAVAGQAKAIGASMIIIGWVVTGVIFLAATGNPKLMGMGKSALIAAIIGTVIIGSGMGLIGL